MTPQKAADLQRYWVLSAEDEFADIATVAVGVQEALGSEASDEEVRAQSLALLEPLLRAGDLIAVDYDWRSWYRPWKGSVEDHILRIDAEWRQLGTRPLYGEGGAFFLGPTSAAAGRAVQGPEIDEPILQRDWVMTARNLRLKLSEIESTARFVLGGGFTLGAGVCDPEEDARVQWRARHDTLRLLRPLLASGALRAADPDPARGPRGQLRFWRGTVEDQLLRIEQAWQALDLRPEPEVTPGDEEDGEWSDPMPERIAQFVAEGIWWVAQDLRALLGPEREDEVRAKTLTRLESLLRCRELIAVDWWPGDRYQPWGGSIEDQLRRVDTEWRHQGAPDLASWRFLWLVSPDEFADAAASIFDERIFQQQWVEAARSRPLELWRVMFGVASITLHPHRSSDWSLVRAETLRLLRPLLESGALRAADPRPVPAGRPDGGIRLWEGSADDQLHRIDHEWQALVLQREDQPSVGDIVRFVAATD